VMFKERLWTKHKKGDHVKKLSTIQIIVCLTIVIGLALPDSAECRGRGMRQSPIFSALDFNDDKVIDATEIQNAATALEQLDQDGDGTITRDEIQPAKGRYGKRDRGSETGEGMRSQGERDGKRYGHRRRAPIFSALDSNDDKMIDTTEIQNATSALLSLDIDSDGQLTRDELRRCADSSEYLEFE